MRILFIQTGGTIDKDYPKTSRGWAFEIDQPASERILKLLNPSFNYEVHTVCRKDSLELTQDDRQQMVDHINNHLADAYIITHGTDTIPETAQFIDARIKDKRIIITGAMRPERFTNSDAAINLGVAIGAAGTVAENGVYIAMHGVVKPIDNSNRDQETGKYF
jgi:L-asparaginase